MLRSSFAFAAALLVAGGAAGGDVPLAAPQAEEANVLARRAVEALARHRTPFPGGIFDERSLVAAAVGEDLAPRLTPRQRREIVERMIDWFGGPFSARAIPAKPPLALGIRAEGGDAIAALLVAVSSGYLKTEWRIRNPGPEGRIEDVALTDLGRSLRQEAVQALGPPPVARPRRRSEEARRAAWPRAAGLVGVLIVAFLFSRRAKPRERVVVLLAAAAPALLFAADGYLAVSRIWNEPIEVRLSDGPPWGYPLQQFQLAVARGNRSRARAAAGAAISLGAAPEPLHLVLGRLAEEAGDVPEAQSSYTRALAPPKPAPGGWAGLARLDTAAGRDTEALRNWTRYFAAAPPDPNSLFFEAVAYGHLRDWEGAQGALARALSLDPSAADLYALSASLYGAAGDAANAIARLRDEEKIRPLDRSRLAADGNFTPIAEDPGWKAFLEEKKP
ncbi:MAG TPA: tetratricopeptide repeat protein [Thermoanaerobaculia bacterium]|nr:tetratricopeptide repeat protein [Thermoanaerobaculia bacterium]